MSKIIIKHLHCMRCNWDWIPRKKVSEIRQCPKCKTAYWQEPKPERVPVWSYDLKRYVFIKK